MLTGRATRPWKVLIYGPSGIGKSTFGAQCPSPIFVDVEDGAGELDVDRFPQRESWPDVLADLRALATEDHDYQTVVIDSLDWLVSAIAADVCAKNKWSNLETPGYGKGPAALEAEFRIFVAALEHIRRKTDCNVLIVAHADVRTIKNPTGEDHQRAIVKVSPRIAAVAREWCDAVLFADLDVQVSGKTGNRKARGMRRILRCEAAASHEAKNRMSLPPTLPLAYSAFADSIVTDSRATLDELLNERDEETAEKARAWIAAQPNERAAISAAIAKLRREKQEREESE